MWRKIAAQDPSFGHPDKFCCDPEQSNWMSATVDDTRPQDRAVYREDLQARPVLRQGRYRRHRHGPAIPAGFSAGRSTASRSSAISRRTSCVVWVYGLFSDKPGDFVKKTMRECTGKEICMEWLYHLGVPEAEIAGSGRAQRQHRPCYDAVYHRVFHAARKGRPPERRAGRSRELRLPRSVCRDGPRYDLHDGVFHPHRYGGRLHVCSTSTAVCRRSGAAPMTYATS